jgi:hypothetical protein
VEDVQVGRDAIHCVRARRKKWGSKIANNVNGPGGPCWDRILVQNPSAAPNEDAAVPKYGSDPPLRGKRCCFCLAAPLKFLRSCPATDVILYRDAGTDASYPSQQTYLRSACFLHDTGLFVCRIHASDNYYRICFSVQRGDVSWHARW